MKGSVFTVVLVGLLAILTASLLASEPTVTRIAIDAEDSFCMSVERDDGGLWVVIDPTKHADDC